MPARKAHRSKLPLLAIATLLLGLTACWVVPYRLWTAGSYYTFSFFGDETWYAERMQPLIGGATPGNTVNGIGSRNAISPFYLDDLCRAIVTASGLNVITVFWILRVVFPICVSLLLAALVLECIPVRRRPWNLAVRLSCAAACLPLLYCGYDWCTRFPRFQGFLNRIPTNIEYPLSIVLAIAALRFVGNPARRNALMLAGLGVLCVYLRPYVALPWGIALATVLAIQLAKRSIPLNLVGMMVLFFVLGMLPWIAISRHNAADSEYQQLLARYFPKWEFAVHARWSLWIGLGAIMLLLSRRIEQPQRKLIVSAALTMFLLPFICSRFAFANELMLFDRFGSFYLVVLLCAGLLALRHWLLTLRGHTAQRAARRISAGALAGGALLSVLLAVANWPAPEFYTEFTLLRDDQRYLAGYEWLREHTPSDALVLVDDGYDWSMLPKDSGQRAKVLTQMWNNDTLFNLVARRRQVYSPRLKTQIISDDDRDALFLAHMCTFGIAGDAQRYAEVMKRFRPTYIFWRRVSALRAQTSLLPIPRGLAGTMNHVQVYTDNACEIWKIEVAGE